MVEFRIVKFHRTVAPSCSFCGKFHLEILTGSPSGGGASNKGGVENMEFSSFMRQCLLSYYFHIIHLQGGPN